VDNNRSYLLTSVLILLCRHGVFICSVKERNHILRTKTLWKKILRQDGQEQRRPGGPQERRSFQFPKAHKRNSKDFVKLFETTNSISHIPTNTFAAVDL
jgi:hypothetical protein